MRIILHPSACPSACKGAAVALGNFDGVHLGHRAILRHTIATAKASGVPAAVMTFEPHPREFFASTRRHPDLERSEREGSRAPVKDPSATPQDDTQIRIYPLRRKIELLREAGIDVLFIARFTKAFAAQTAQAFVEDVLHRQLAASHVVTGSNFGFGKGRGGDTAFLDKAAAALGMGYTACPPVYDAQGNIVSSSAIRAHLAAGDMRAGAALLGQPYRIEGRVRRGQQRGRELGFPTENLPLTHLFKPRFGVYAVRASLGGGPWLDGVASLGVNPTFGLDAPLLETHIFDTNRSGYGQRLRVEMIDFIRDERRFDTIEALQAQMAQDCEKARELLNIPSPLEGEGQGGG